MTSYFSLFLRSQFEIIDENNQNYVAGIELKIQCVF